MKHPSFVLLYVDHPLHSATFYHDLLGTAPVEVSPTFALFVLESGLRLGLWARETVMPVTSETRSSSFELAWPVETHAEVDATAKDWASRGIPILQTPTQMDFGYTMTASDPDGHRVRVFCPT